MPLDPRSDLFSLGVLIYEMSSGSLPFAGDSPGDTVTNILERDPVPLARRAPDRRVALVCLVTKLLAKRADGRFESAAALVDALSRVGAADGPGPLRRLFGG